jgi:hypothetical protein
VVDLGKVEVDGNHIRLTSEGAGKPFKRGTSRSLDLYVVKWGKRVYLIRQDGLLRFCNAVNATGGRDAAGFFWHWTE